MSKVPVCSNQVNYKINCFTISAVSVVHSTI